MGQRVESYSTEKKAKPFPALLLFGFLTLILQNVKYDAAPFPSLYFSINNWVNDRYKKQLNWHWYKWMASDSPLGHG